MDRLKPTKILHVYKHAKPDTFGGIEGVIETLVTNSKAGFEQVDVIGCVKSGGARTFKHKSHNVHLFKTVFSIGSTPFSLQMAVWAWKNFRNYHFIYLHYPFPFGDLLALLCKKHAKLLVMYHSDIVSQPLFLRAIYRPLEKLMLHLANRIVATSPQYAATSKNLKNNRKKLEIIPIGVEDVSKHPRNVPALSFDFEASFFLFIGQFRRYKGLQSLLEAAPIVKGNILIVGISSLEASKKQLFVDRNLDNVTFAGKLTEQEKHYCLSKCQGLVLPSNKRSEAYGVCLVEAAAFGVPLVTCEINTGTSFVNLHGITGFVVEKDNSTSLAFAMNKILHDPQLQASLGSGARHHYELNFRARSMVSKHKKLLDKIV